MAGKTRGPKKGTGGRSTILTKELCKRVCQLVGKGVPYKIACDGAGLSYDTFLLWKKKAIVILETKAPSKYNKKETNLVKFLTI